MGLMACVAVFLRPTYKLHLTNPLRAYTIIGNDTKIPKEPSEASLNEASILRGVLAGTSTLKPETLSLVSRGARTQRAQYPLIEEYTLNHSTKPRIS